MKIMCADIINSRHDVCLVRLDVMKIILSRKGFDSDAGGYPSPYFKDSGRLLSFPIPAELEEELREDALAIWLFDSLRFNKELTYLDIMKQLGINQYEGELAHVDPDIDYDVLKIRKSGWKGMFGPSGAAQTHLSNKDVKVGDLFLFFGWFRDAEMSLNGYKYVKSTDKHIIWGYLQVGEIDYVSCEKEYEIWRMAHPHYYYSESYEGGVVYIASDKLTFNDKLPGSGVFNFREELVLTAPNQNSKRLWSLPACFHPSFGTNMSYHEKFADKSGKIIWDLKGDKATLMSACRGQEFVVDGNKDVENWAKSLFNKSSA